MQTRTGRGDAAIDRHLPLRPAACAVLAALAERPCAGIEILEAVNRTVPGEPLLGPGTLYRLLRELRQDGLITRAGGRDLPDERRVPHVLTALGRRVLDAEVSRLERTLRLARRRKAAESS